VVYLNSQEVANKWGISAEQVRTLCRQNRIAGARKLKNRWEIPNDAISPLEAPVFLINKSKSHDANWISSILKIQKAQDNNQLVIFVGAGVSKNSGIPAWGELIEKIAMKIGYSQCLKCNVNSKTCEASKCKEKYHFSQDDYLRIPEYFYQSDTSKDHHNYYSTVQTILRGTNVSNPIDDQIFSILPNHIITTNFDPLLENSYSPNRNYYTVVCEDDDLLSNPSNHYIIKMHGDLEKPRSLVLKESDYIDYEQNHPLISTFIRSLLINHTFLFLGYSLNDYNLNLIIGWINYFAKIHGIQNRPMSFLIETQNPSIFERKRLLSKNISIVDLNTIPDDALSKITIPDAISHPIGQKLYVFLRSITDPQLMQNYIPLETLLMNKYNLLNSYTRISYHDLVATHPLGKTELSDSTLLIFEGQWYERIVELVKRENSPFSEVLHRTGITQICSYFEDKCQQISQKTDYSDSFFQSYLDNDYTLINKNINNMTNIAQKIYYSHLLQLSLLNSQNLLKKEELQIVSKDPISILLHKIRSRLVTITFFDRQTEKANEINRIFDTIPPTYRHTLTFLRNISNSSSDYFIEMQELLEKHEKRFEQNSSSWISGHAHTEIWKLKAWAYDYYFYFKENYLPMDRYSEAKNFLCYYLQAILCTFSPSAPQPRRDSFPMRTHRQNYPIGEIDLDMFVKFSKSQTLLSWFKKYSVHKIEISLGVNFILKFSNICKCYLDYDFLAEPLYCFIIILSFLDLSSEQKKNIYSSMLGVITACKNKKICLKNSFLSALIHMLSYIPIEDNSVQADLLEVLLSKEVYLPLLAHESTSLNKISNIVKNSVDEKVVNNLIYDIRQLTNPKEQVNRTFVFLPLLPSYFCEELITKNATLLSASKLYQLLIAKKVKYESKYWSHFVNTIETEEINRKNNPAVRSFPDIIVETINNSIILKLLGYSVDLTLLEPYRHYSDHLSFILHPDLFDYTLVDTADYMWHNLIYSKEYRHYFIQNKKYILSETLKQQIELELATPDQIKVIYSVLLSPEEASYF